MQRPVSIKNSHVLLQQSFHSVLSELGLPNGSAVKNSPAMQEMWVQSLWEGPLEKEMATHSSILAWEIPWTEESGGLQYMDCKSQTRLSD